MRMGVYRYAAQACKIREPKGKMKILNQQCCNAIPSPEPSQASVVERRQHTNAKRVCNCSEGAALIAYHNSPWVGPTCYRTRYDAKQGDPCGATAREVIHMALDVRLCRSRVKLFG